MKVESSFSHGYLSGKSYVGGDPEVIWESEPDLLVLVSSWEPRSLTVAEKSNIKAKYSISVHFESEDSRGLQRKHDKLIVDFAKNSSRQHFVVKGHSLHIKIMWDEIFSRIAEIREKVGRPLQICFDLTSCPKYFALATLAKCLKLGVVRKIIFFYAEGTYPEDDNKEFRLTGGNWRQIAIPGLEGIDSSGRNKFYFVSVGWEGHRIYRAISRADPERISILFPNPGFHQKYPQKTKEKNSELINKYKIPDDQIVEASAGDAIASWRALHKARRERPLEENTFYVCCGSKPQAVAFALRAMNLEYPTVLYFIPDEHRVVYTVSNGRFWRYEITDITSFA